MLRRLCTRLARQLVSPPAEFFARGAILAICLATLCLQFVALLGTSFPVTTAMLAAIGMGIAAAALTITRFQRISLPGFSTGAVLHFVLAAWMVASPSLLRFVDWIVGRPGFISLTSPGWNAALFFVLATVGLGLPAYLAAQSAAGGAESPEKGPRRFRLVFLGAAAGLSIWGLGLGQIMGPYYCGVAAASLGLAMVVARTWYAPHADTSPGELSPSCA